MERERLKPGTPICSHGRQRRRSMREIGESILLGESLRQGAAIGNTGS